MKFNVGPKTGVRILILLGWLTLTWPCLASSPERPRIGLALSGGGSKGLAHIGVLKILEELEVPIDFIAGTSMGSVIGGLYASGMTATELETIMMRIDWKDLLDDQPPRRLFSFRRKQDQRRYQILELGIRDKTFKLPSGFQSGQGLLFQLRSLTLPVAELTRFDDLPIPFRSVATNMETGEMIILDQGDLALAMRASMSIPGVFTPTEIDGRLLGDGGLVRNLPVDVVRAMGADVVIAVDITEPFLKKEELDSLIDIAYQTVSMLSRLNVREMREQAEIVIAPDVAGIPSMDFNDVPSLIALGAAESERFRDCLAALSHPEAFAGQTRIARTVPDWVIASVDFAGLKRVEKRVLHARIDLRQGMPLTLASIEKAVNRLQGLDDFESIDYRLKHGPQGVDVIFELREKSWGPFYLRLGVDLIANPDRNSSFNMLINFRAARLNQLGGEWNNHLSIGTRDALLSEFYQPLDYSEHFFVAAVLDLSSREFGLFKDGFEIADVDRRYNGLRLDTGLHPGVNTEIRLGLYRGETSVAFRSGDPDILEPDSEFNLPGSVAEGGLRLAFLLDLLDAAAFPRTGHKLRIDAIGSQTELGADRNYDKAELRYAGFASRGRHTGFLQLWGGSDFDTNLPDYEQFTLGGFLSLSGYQLEEFRANEYALARLGYYHEIPGISMGGVIPRFLLGGWAEIAEIRENGPLAEPQQRSGAMLMVGADTLIGPVTLGFGFGEDNAHNLSLTAGIVF